MCFNHCPRWIATSCAATMFAIPAISNAAEAISRKGHGHFSVGYQYISVDGFQATTGKSEIGTTDTHTISFDFDYGLTDRLTISAGIPLVRKRYRGPFPHDPAGITDGSAEGAEYIDDGDYHTDFQDFHVGLRFLAKDGPLMIEPFVFAGIPSHDYAFFGHSAVGQNLFRVDVGASFTYFPAFSDFYFRIAPSYVFVEETLGVNIDHFRLDAEIGYFATRRLGLRAFVNAKEGKGLDFPDDLPPPRNDNFWYQHDRMVRHNYVNAGVGFDWAVDSKYTLTMTAITQIASEQVHIMDWTVGTTLSRSF